MFYIFNLIFFFYQKFLWISLLLNFIFLGFNVPLPYIFLYKFSFGLFLFWWYKSQRKKQQLIFYNNLKIGNNKLFILCFIYDAVLLIASYLIFSLLV